MLYDKRKPYPKKINWKGRRYMTVKEAAEKWGYAEATVRRWCRAGSIEVVQKAKKVNGRWEIPENATCPRPIKKKS